MKYSIRKVRTRHRLERHILRGFLLLSILSGPLSISQTAIAQTDVPTEAARRVAEVIRREALLPPNSPEGRPLPLASHWNVGTVRNTFTPDHQIGLLQAGHHILPWMAWPQSRGNKLRFRNYTERLLRFFAELRLPISMRGTQWNAMLVNKTYRKNPDAPWAGVIAPDGSRQPTLSPFGDIEVWKDPARVFVDQPAMKRAQEIYPDPPLVLWVSNNEPRSLRWSKNGALEKLSGRYLDLYGKGRSDEFKRKVVAEGWMKRYPVMFQAMRDALVSDTWKKNVRFIGYGAFGPAHFGRWGKWKDYSLITDEWTSPNWYFWDGGSPSYYTNNWSDNRDNRVFSTQIESMNWVFMLKEAWRVNPDFWFEMSTWDGNDVKRWADGLAAVPGTTLAQKSSRPLKFPLRGAISKKNIKKSKALQYMVDGQTYPPARAAGWIQFGMWLMRPRVVREFRGHATPLEPVLPYWMEVVSAVDRVYEDSVLTTFWRSGTLVANTAHRHPYQVRVPDKYKSIRRWFLLDTNLDPDRPWDLRTTIPVFSLALVRGSRGAREWLVYTHSPLENRTDVEIMIPEYRRITVDVPRAGAFYLVSESSGRVERIE